MAPEIYFFDIVRQTNTIIFLVDKLFADSLVPLGKFDNIEKNAIIPVPISDNESYSLVA